MSAATLLGLDLVFCILPVFWVLLHSTGYQGFTGLVCFTGLFVLTGFLGY